MILIVICNYDIVLKIDFIFKDWYFLSKLEHKNCVAEISNNLLPAFKDDIIGSLT